MSAQDTSYACRVAAQHPADRPGRRLVCAECGDESEAGAVGWRAYLDDDGAARIFCPRCSPREFDGD